MSIQDRLFYRKNLEFQNQILNNLDAHIDEVKDSRTLNKRVHRLVTIGISQFNEQFPKVFPENEYGKLSAYEFAEKSGIDFFCSVETLKYLKNLVKTENDQQSPLKNPASPASIIKENSIRESDGSQQLNNQRDTA